MGRMGGFRDFEGFGPSYGGYARAERDANFETNQNVVAFATTWPAFDPLDSIDSGFFFAGNTIDVYFGPNGYSPAAGIETSEGFNAYEIQQFTAAFDMIEAVTGLTFNVVNDPAQADFRLVLDTNEMDPGILGYFYLPTGGSLAGIGAFNGNAWDRTAGGDLEVGGYGFVTIMHELLHGLGLAHPHDNGGSSIVLPGVTTPFGEAGAYDLNQGIYTTLTYNSGFLTGPVGTAPSSFDWGWDAGPMALDIAVLQQYYGANNTTNTGNDTYTLPGTGAQGTFWQSIWDAGGIDEIVYTGATGSTIDLRPATLQDEFGGGGWVSAVNGIAGGFTIANGVVIENATGGSGADTINGNDAVNTLTGNGGADTITGGKGGDTIYAGAQADNVHGNNGYDTIYGGDGDDYLRGGAKNDTIYGENGNDTLRGNGGADLLDGGADNDNLNSGGGNDTLIGGAGDDWAKGGAGADTFIFIANADEDRVADFDIAEGDTLEIDASHWGGLTQADDLIATYASVTADGVVFDFGGGDVLILEGLTTTTGLDTQISMG